MISEEMNLFYAALHGVMTKTNGLTLILEDVNASLGDSVPGIVGPHGLSKETSDNGERLVDFTSTPNVYNEHTILS